MSKREQVFLAGHGVMLHHSTYEKFRSHMRQVDLEYRNMGIAIFF